MEILQDEENIFNGIMLPCIRTKNICFVKQLLKVSPHDLNNFTAPHRRYVILINLIFKKSPKIKSSVFLP